MRIRPKQWRTHLLSALAAPTLPYGGQAAMEGVMMKGTKHAALAMRRADGTLDVLDREVVSRFPRLTRLPVLRGFFILWDMMTLGMWALRESGHRYEVDMEAKEAEAKGEEVKERSLEAEKPGIGQAIVMGLSLVIALLVFKVLPAVIASGVFVLMGKAGDVSLVEAIKGGTLSQVEQASFGIQFLANMVEGLVKLAIFVTYIWSVGKIKEIARVFEYHGAEHIVINAYEDDETRVQDVKFIQEHSVAHPRCGTSFIVILILMGIVLFTVLDWGLAEIAPSLISPVSNLPVWWVRWPLRILALPLLSGLSYEVIKSAFKYFGNPIVRPLLKFGMLFQSLTTRRPDDEQVGVSLASFNRARFLTEGIAEPPAPTAATEPAAAEA